MADREVDFLLVGAGQASASCAAALRKGGDGSILMVGREPEPPYERPPLSKEYLRGDASREDAHVEERSWYEEHGVELLTGKNVMLIDPEAKTAKIQGGEEVAFGAALLATGANVNILRIEGAENEGIHYLRAFGNADAIREDAKEAGRVVLVGGSYIAAEVAASLAAQGTACTMVAEEEIPLSRTFGADAGRFFQEGLEEHGVTFVGGETVSAFEGDGRVSSVLTASGRSFDCDLVVVGAGVKPDTMLAGRAGLAVENGIVCDSKLRTSAAGIYAAGDVCNWESVVHGRRIRVEHWDVAFNQGMHAARNMLGADEDYDVVPYFFSDLADWASLEYVGPAPEWDQEIWRGSRDEGEFSLWYLQGGKVAGCLSVGRSEDLAEARRLIHEGTDIAGAVDRIADPDADLSSL